jgi:formamidopyrimidine-DNA glycosylase
MPELPDILLYLHALTPRIAGRRIMGVRRLGKRIVMEAEGLGPSGVEGELFLVFHLMIAGRFRWKPPGAAIPGKIGLLALDFEHGALRRGNHMLKRALTDPHVFSGIGNAYSDEILHAARLSPFKQTATLTDEEIRRLFDAVRLTLMQWTTKLQSEAGDEFPEKVTAFHAGMAVHGRYRLERRRK